MVTVSRSSTPSRSPVILGQRAPAERGLDVLVVGAQVAVPRPLIDLKPRHARSRSRAEVRLPRLARSRRTSCSPARLSTVSLSCASCASLRPLP